MNNKGNVHLLLKKGIITPYMSSLIVVALLTLFPTFFLLVMQVRQDDLTGEMNNFRIYLATGLVFLVTLSVSLAICKLFWKKKEDTYIKEFGTGITCISIFLQTILFIFHIRQLVKCYQNSTSVYPYRSGEWLPWHMKEDWKVFAFMVMIGSAGIIVSLWSQKKRKVIEIMRFPIYLLASLIGGASMYCTNFMTEDILHGNSYFASVYTALMGAPYDYANQSIYGHYAMFLKYPVKLLGGDYRAYNIVISLVGALSIFMVALALDMCVKNHFISMIGTWALPMMYWYYPKNHWQMFPHRVVFACVLLYVIARYFHKNEKWMKFVGYGVAGLGFLWNTETGAICMIVWMLGSILHELIYEGKGVKWLGVLKSIFRNTAYLIASIVGMVCLFNLYNMPLGEEWHGFRFLLFPLDGGWDKGGTLIARAAQRSETLQGLKLVELLDKFDSKFASGLSQPLIYQTSPWYFVFLLMGIAIILMLVRVMHKKASANSCVMGLAAILALGQLYYFFNRPCFDYLSIAEFEAVLIMAILADEKAGWGSGWYKKPYQLLFIAIMTVLSVFALWQVRFRYYAREAEGYYDKEQQEALLEDIKASVPENTFAIGQGVQEIYSALGWDTRCYPSDFSSWPNTHSVGRVIMEASEQKECVISVRNKKKNGEISAEEYMGWWGFESDAITVKEHWSIDTDETWYWDIYYMDIDRSIENRYYNMYKDKI